MCFQTTVEPSLLASFRRISILKRNVSMNRRRLSFRRRLVLETLDQRTLMAGDLSTGLVGYWPLNSTSGITAIDFAGGDDPGTLINNPTWTTNGSVHGALNFNGTNQSVSIAYSTSLDIGGGSIVVSAWIKSTALNGTVVCMGPLTGDHIVLQVVNGKARFQFSPGLDTGEFPYVVTGSKTVNDGNWHLLIGVRTGLRSSALYVDGVLEGEQNGNGTFTGVNVTTALLFGAAQSTTTTKGNYFAGTIDDVRFYNDRVFSAVDAAALYALRNSPFTTSDSYVFLSQSQTINAAQGVLKNDSPRDDLPLTASLITNALHGNVTLNADGSFTYVPQTNYSGPDSFTYRVSDGVADPTGATVSLTVYSLAEWSTIATRISDSVMVGASSITAATVNSTIALMNPDGSFSDLTYVANTTVGATSINTHNSRLTTLAKAYSVVGGPKYNDATVLQKIIDGYTYLANTAPNSLTFPNWYDTKISVPEGLWQGLVVIRSQLSPTLTSSLVTKYFDLATAWDLADLSNKMSGANLVDRASSAIAFSILKNDPTLLLEVTAMIAKDLNYAGIQVGGRLPDNGFAQHSVADLGATFQGGYHAGMAVQMLAGSYGMVYADELSSMLPWLHGTPFAFSSNAETAFVEWVLDGQAWLFGDKRIEPTVLGREITRRGSSLSKASALGGYATRIQALGIRTTELTTLTNRMTNGTTSTNLLSGNKSFFSTDMMVQQRLGYMASVRMHSQRSLRPETLQIPGGSAPDGAKNFFMADGVTTLYQDGTEYGTTSGQEIFPAWNWTRLPGTTLEQLTDAQVISLSTTNASNLSANIGTGAFVGSVSNGTNGAAAMDYGRTLGSVTAKKGYFYFDEGYIALGAGINAPTSTNPVYTSLNQVLQNGVVTVKANDGSVQTLNTGTSQSFTNPKWILHSGVGYMLLGNNGTVTAQAQSQTGTWESIGTTTGTVTQNVFSAWVDHGNNPSNGQYAYAVLPGATTTSLDSYVSASPFAILSNTASIQAVRQASTGTTQIAFYQAGSLTIATGLTVTVDKPCMLQVRELSGGNIEVAVSDPTQSVAQVNVTMSRHLNGAGAIWSYTQRKTDIPFTLPTGTNNIYAGQSVVASFTNVPAASVQGRFLYYNRAVSTTFNNGSANPTAAIDTSKTALLPGDTASFANYSNYSRGINGLIVDIANSSNVSASDFQFAAWNGIANSGFVNTWSTPTVTKLAGSGLNGSDRFKIEFPDSAIRDTWLRVTVLANANTQLLSNDVFYFGNAIGDVGQGNSGTPISVRADETDSQFMRRNQSPGANSASITNVYDLNKDGRVNAIDLALLRQNQAKLLIRYFTAPVSLRLAFATSGNGYGATSMPVFFGTNLIQDSPMAPPSEAKTLMIPSILPSALTVNASLVNPSSAAKLAPPKNESLSGSLRQFTISQTSFEEYFKQLGLSN